MAGPAEFNGGPTAHWLPGGGALHQGPPNGHFQPAGSSAVASKQPGTHWMLQHQDATSESSTACDNEEIKFGPFSDGEADKCHYRRTMRSRSLPRRPASSMMNYHHHPIVPHYVTLSRASMLEAGDGGARLFEQQSLQFSSRTAAAAASEATSHHHHHPHHRPHRYSSQPHLNQEAILDFNQPPYSSRPSAGGGPPPLKMRTTSASKSKKSQEPQGPPPKYQQPVAAQSDCIENAEYLFPDLPPPPDALLDNTQSTSPQSLQQNSRCSSLDDLNWVTSAADMSRSLQVQKCCDKLLYEVLNLFILQVQQKIDFHMLPNGSRRHKSNTLPSQPSQAFGSKPAMFHNHHGTMQHPISIMKKRVVSNPIELQQQQLQRRSSGAVKVDLSSADKTIRRPGSEPDLKTSPMRSSMRTNTPSSNDIKRLSGVSQGSSKKVMFSGVASDHDDDDSNGQDNVWVLRAEPVNPEQFKPFELKDDEDDVPVTGVVIAQPQPCKFALAQAQFLQAQQQVKVSPSKKVKATPPPPPPRTTPVNPANAGQPAAANPSANGQNVVRPANPVLQRPAAQQFHESPDEGYHEDDNGSEIL